MQKEDKKRKNLVLIAHDNLKPSIIEWAKANRERLSGYHLFATGTTGSLIESALQLPVTKFKSGPLGGDQQIGARIAEGGLDAVIFFWDPMAPHPHDVDVKALIRIAAVYNVPIACNRATAEMLLPKLLA